MMTIAKQSSGTARIGFFSWFGYELPFAQRLTLLKTAGYSNISIWLGPEEQLVRNGQTERMCELAATSALHVECAHADYRDCNHMWDGTVAESARLAAQMQEQIQLCIDNDIPILVVHICKGSAPPNPNPQGLGFIRRLVEMAVEGGLVIAIENTRKPDMIDFVLSAIEAPNLGLCYDSSHDFLHSPRPTALLKDWGHRLAYTHLSDNDGTSDTHLIPGEGTIDWDLIESAFPQGFRGNISLEVMPRDASNDPAEGFLARSLQKAKWLQAKLLR